jgi:serine/threonine protein kinase/tetratricopeptide (TPR) repeat protein
MSTRDRCPDNQLYLRLLRGELALFEVELVTSHLEQCESCEKTMQELNGEDALLNEVRAARLRQSDEREVTADLIAQWCALPSQMTPVVTTINQDTPLGERPDHYEFLAPGDGPDEIGRLGPYRVLGVLGAGGMGVVFQAEDVLLGRVVALKAIRPALAVDSSTRERFLREARAMAAVKHDHIATMYQVGEDRGIPYMAMEFLEGETLESRLKRLGILSSIETVEIGRQIAEGLAAAHAQGLIHRDIKPSNVWLETRSHRELGRGRKIDQPESQTNEGPVSAPGRSSAAHTSLETDFFRVKILDFGLARAVSGDTDLTQTGAVLGTPAYMPPEQAEGEGVDSRADLYSLGCVLYRVCTGRLPFEGKSKMAIWQAQALRDPLPPAQVNPKVPEELSRLILKLLAREVQDRPASARDVVRALESLKQTVDQLGATGKERSPQTGPVGAPRLEVPPSQTEQQQARGQSVPETPRFRRRRSSPLRGRWLPSARTVSAFAALGSLLLVVGLGGTALVHWWPGSPTELTRSTAPDTRLAKGTAKDTREEGPPRTTKTLNDDSARHFLEVASTNARSGNWAVARDALINLKKMAKESGGLGREDSARILAWEALAEEGGTQARLERLLPLYPTEDQQSDISAALLPQWEREQVMVLGQELARKGDLEQVLDQADAAKALQLAKLVRVFDEANKLANEEIPELEAIVKGREAKDLDGSEQKLDQLLQGQLKLHRPGDLINSYVDLTIKDKEQAHRVRAIDTLFKVVGNVANEKKAEAIKSFHVLLSKEVDDRFASLEKQSDFLRFRQYCRELAKGQPNDRALACLAEALIRTGENSPALIREAHEAAWKNPALKDAGAYGHFARGTVLNAEGKPAEAVKEFDAAFTQKESWQNPARRRQAADIYFDVAAKAPMSEAAFKWQCYKKAVDQHPSPPVEYRLALAEEALRLNPPDKASAKAETSRLLQELGVERLGRNAYRVLEIQAGSLGSPGEIGSALPNYWSLISSWQEGRLPDIRAPQFFAQIVEPVTAMTRRWLQESAKDSERRKQFARLCALRGDVLYQHQDQEFAGLKRKPIDEAAASYAEAAAQYPAKDEVLANYLMWQGYLLTRISARNVGKVRELADRAMAAAAKSDAALFLEGATLYYEALAATDRKESLGYLDKAVDTLLTNAIQVGAAKNNPPELLHAYYEIRSWANVVRANYLYGAKGEQAIGIYREYLKEARKDAEKVLNEMRPRDLTDAYIAQGNALEDLAWLCHEEGLWDPALDAFGNAIRESHSLNPVPLVSHGRTNYKRFSYSSKKRSDLVAAEKDLAAACELFQLGHNKDTEAEAHIWLGQVYLGLADDVKAADHILQGIKLATGGWLGYSVYVVESEIARAKTLSGQQGVPLLQAAHEHCRLLRERKAAPRPALVDLLARSWAYEARALATDEKPAKARKAFDEALKAYDGELAGKHRPTIEDVQLLLGRSRLVLNEPELEKQDLEQTEPQCAADALEAARLAEEGHLSGELRAQGYSQAGLAYYDKGIFSKALKNFKEALDIAPAHADNSLWRNSAGMACLRLMLKADRTTPQGQQFEKEAREHFGAVLKDPKASNASKKQAETYLEGLDR